MSVLSGGWTRRGWIQESGRSGSSAFDGQNPGGLCIRDQYDFFLVVVDFKNAFWNS